MNASQLAQYFDHTLLRADATPADFAAFCADCRRYGFAMAAINSAPVRRVKELLRGSPVHVGAAIGFPLGQTRIDVKLLETRLAAQGLYIAARREAPIDFPLALQRRLFAPLAPSAPGISVTEAGVFRPVKSMLFCLDTTPTPCHGQAAHDCSRCRMQHCPYRRLRTQSIGSSTHNQTEDRRP